MQQKCFLLTWFSKKHLINVLSQNAYAVSHDNSHINLNQEHETNNCLAIILAKNQEWLTHLPTSRLSFSSK